ncbi:DUF1579 domain-containing protein [Paucibacter sp. APW11]|uniref:DUF1579 domain-containing protein n=1 Tax=Roseateles aquae TaxID=3077235 RepID=A0ABU3P687_9BURK|nr:DUF1579 domain-containing protein [Paucibacter sp. APW11]MDT8998097.1 DUF1579 domain-containing protein [Paucibacter sp. APW11]
MSTSNSLANKPEGATPADAIDPLTRAAQSPGDFDFFFGEWTVRHRRLKRRLAGCLEWQQFDGRSSARPLLGGLGNIDDNWLDLPEGAYRAVTLRSYDPTSGLWSIWWLDGRAPGRLDSPMRGRFEAGVGQFYAEDQFEGRPIRVRFLWFATPGQAPRWEQAFSADDGHSWETNWTMEFLPWVPR